MTQSNEPSWALYTCVRSSFLIQLLPAFLSHEVKDRKQKSLRKMTNIYLKQKKNAPNIFGFVFIKRVPKLVIYVSAAEMKSLNQDTNDLVIGIYAFYQNVNDSFGLCCTRFRLSSHVIERNNPLFFPFFQLLINCHSTIFRWYLSLFNDHRATALSMVFISSVLRVYLPLSFDSCIIFILYLCHRDRSVFDVIKLIASGRLTFYW